ncbi:hypothetical protein [Xanthomonas bromi]|uniref:hypothetical protein n=1 Tax=Xanthomonas bromi TaxID=56449 RepID=UPI0011121945|nr:hypothetical protein [Xanthomonas bromi]
MSRALGDLFSKQSAAMAQRCRHVGKNPLLPDGRRLLVAAVASVKNWIYLAVAICADVTATAAPNASDGVTRM